MSSPPRDPPDASPPTPSSTSSPAPSASADARSFAELGLPPALVAALAKQQIEEPTAIQRAALPLLLAGKDAFLNAETGTGKTLAYLLPLFCRIDPQLAATQVVVVAPTHELAIQIQRQSALLAQNAGSPVRTLLLIGGTSLDRQLEKLKKKPQIVVGSPGRICDLLRLGKLKLQHARAMVVDEADQLVQGEWLPAIQTIVRAGPAGLQLLFASATEQEESAVAIARLAPQRVLVQTAAAPVNPAITHLWLGCDRRDKPDIVRKLFHALDPARALVFVHQNDTAEEIAAKLEYHHIPVADLHGAFRKDDRKEAMDSFRSGHARVLIASDLAARGLDIPGISHIINLDVPTLSRGYLHRVGRTARAGAKGSAITLMTPQEERMIARYEKELGITMRQVWLRDGTVVEAGGAAGS